MLKIIWVQKKTLILDLLVFDGNAWNHLTVCKQIINITIIIIIIIRQQYLKPFKCV